VCSPKKKEQQTNQKKRKSQSKTTKKTKPNNPEEDDMATGGDITLRDVSHPALNEALKAHNSVTFRLVRTGE
jgi:hypothetical protein